MTRGMDAADVALTTSFGPTTLKKFTVMTEEIQESILVGCRDAILKTRTQFREIPTHF